MAFQITEATWLAQQSLRVGNVLKSQMKHNQSYTAAQLVTLITDVFPTDTYTPAELITLRDALVSDGVIEIV
ncbi:unnamed protein product [marine sediment metagenome]|uniref:Uncharacterized protein n=1 Tax=marine sediment metagenome TaxID=412755 RepID=X1CKD5_9ZZZZ